MLQDEGLEVNDENLFIALSCAEKGIAFLKGDAKVNVRKLSEMEASGKKKSKKGDGMENYTVVVDGKQYNVTVAEGNNANVQISESAAPAAAPAAGGNQVHVHAPLPGSVFKVLVKPGDKVTDGQAVMILEAMKMETEITSPANGTVVSVDANVGDSVENNQVLVTIAE
jgi:pyruvate carboxylase subunit B